VCWQRRFRIPNEPKEDFFVNDLSAYKCFLIYTRLIIGGTSRTFECFDTKARKWINISTNPDLQRPMHGEFQFLKNGMFIVESLNNNTFFFFDYLRPFDKKLYLTPALKSLSWLAIIVAVSCLGGYQFPKFKYHFFMISFASVYYMIYKNNMIRNFKIAFSK
jgi:hypothetical protein